MPRHATKRNTSQRQPTSESTSISTISHPPASDPLSSTLPTNFALAPQALTTTLLSHLPTRPIYLIHTDTASPYTKRRTFLVPVYINLFIVAILALRAYYAAPSYLDLLVGISGLTRSSSPTGKTALVEAFLGTTASRFALFVLDYFVFVVLGSWPWEFVRGNKYNGYVAPLGWRRGLGSGGLRWGFRDREVVVRRSKGLHLNVGLAGGEDADGAEGAGTVDARGQGTRDRKWNLDDELKLKAAIVPALEERRLREKTGYLLVDREWDLDFRAMVTAHRVINKGELSWEDLQVPTAYAWYGGRWICWSVQDDSAPKGADGLPQSDIKANGKIGRAKISNQNKNDLEAVQKLDRFRKSMDDRGCEDIFFRWIEIVQFESSVPGGLTEGGKGRALTEFKELLQEKGVDLAEVLEVVGGVKGLPGMEEG